jgi:hypothetical protein
MTFDEHYEGVGRIVGNLQSLELVLRLFLYEEKAEEGQLPQPGDTTVRETWLTNYKSLGEVVSAYNAKLTKDEMPRFVVDNTVVAVRDALAHGRVVSLKPSPPFTLFKFVKPRKGIVPIESADELALASLNTKINLTHAQIIKVTECAKGRGHEWLE